MCSSDLVGDRLANGFELEGMSFPTTIDDHGRVTWFGFWRDGDDARHYGLFIDHQLVLETGMTNLDGEIMGNLFTGLGGGGWSVSDDGRQILLQSAGDGLYLVTVPEPGAPALGMLAASTALARRARRRTRGGRQGGCGPRGRGWGSGCWRWASRRSGPCGGR